MRGPKDACQPDINKPANNPVVEAVRRKVLHLGAMFGTEARITQSYRRILFLLPKNAKERHLAQAVKKVEESTN